MKFGFLPAAALTLAAPLAMAQAAATCVPDKAHSEVDFSVSHLGLTHVHGRFGNIGGSIVLNPADLTKSYVRVTIDVTTVDTGVGPRDSDLKSSNFFDVAQFPTATFVSTGIAKNGNGYTVNGNLTLHGVTKPVVLQVEAPNGPRESPLDHKAHTGFSATATISRLAFGIAPKYSDAVVGDDVKLTVELDAVQQ